MTSADLFDRANQACLAAGKEILKVYERVDLGVEIKDNRTPLTEADRAGHEVITDYLTATGIPVLSEEGKDIPYSERKGWERFWLVDPLDGTKEFIKRNGEFTVNIALIERSEPVFGSVFVPVTNILYHGGRAYTARRDKNGESKELAHNPKPFDLKQKTSSEGLAIVASRSHQNPETEEFLNQLSKPRIVSMGSSLKFMALAEQEADIYPRYAPTMEWDTGAAHAVISSLGYRVHVKDSKTPLIYNKENLLNPYFICF